MENLKDWSKYKHLTDKTKQNLAATDTFNKSKSIHQLYQIQESVIRKAEVTGDKGKIRDAHQFASRLEGEIRFFRNSK